MSTVPHARSALRGAALVIGYAAAVVWLTWPLAASLDSLLPGSSIGGLRFDPYYSTWVLAHGSHALASSQASFVDANIYHPAANSLFYGPAALGALPLFAPVFLASGNPVLAINVTFILGIALMGVAMHVVVRRWTGSDLAAVVGAATVILNQWLLRGFVPTAPHWAVLFWMPLIAFVAARGLDSWRGAVVLTLLLVLQCSTDLVYVAAAVLAPLGVLAAWRLIRPSTRTAGARLVLAIALALMVLAPVYYGYLAVEAANPDLADQTRWKQAAAAPSVIPEVWLRGYVPLIVTPVAVWLVTAGAIAAILRRRSGARRPQSGGWAQGALWTAVGLSLAVNPVVHLGGQVFASPLGWAAAWLPSLDALRVPTRLGITGLVGLGILSGVAFGDITDRARAHILSRAGVFAVNGVLAAIVLVSVYRAYAGNYWTWTGTAPMPQEYPLLSPPDAIPESFRAVLEASKEPLLELPAPLGTGNPVPHARAMFRSIAHWRPLLNGYASYWPAGFNERMALASRLPAQDALDRLVADTGLSLIWIHGKELMPAQRAAWESATESGDRDRSLALVAREGAEMLFAVSPASEAATAD